MSHAPIPEATTGRPGGGKAAFLQNQQIATAIAGAAIVPAVTGMTLGIVRQAGFNRQIGRNQAFNHAGNMVGAALSGNLTVRAASSTPTG